MQSNLTTIINLLQTFQSSSSGSTRIEDFAFGNLAEITTSKSQSYPLMYVELDKSTIKSQSVIISLNILIGEQDANDRSDRLAIYNKCLLIHESLIQYLRTNSDSANFEISEQIT